MITTDVINTKFTGVMIGGVLQVVAYSILAPALPFPVMCVGEFE